MKCKSCAAEVAPRAPFCANCGARVEDPFVGTVIEGRYRIDSKIADGGFGAIYRGTQLNIQRPVAIKVMHEDLNVDDNLVARFRREGVVLCSLRDAHSVTTYELGETAEGRMFIVMELLTGRTLLDVARAGGPLPWQRMLGIARQICTALAEAHALGIVHRDLKPANIYLEDRKNTDFVKVLDFGIAKIMHGSGIADGADQLTKMGQAVGTLEYMAPEQLMGGKCDGRTDIYTLGVVSYEMICGRRPFHDVAGLDLLTEQLSRTPPPPSEMASMTAAAEQVLLRCLEQDAAERFADVAELGAAIEEALISRGSSPIIPTPLPKLRTSGLADESVLDPPTQIDVRAGLADTELAGEGVDADSDAARSTDREVAVGRTSTERDVPAPPSDTDRIEAADTARRVDAPVVPDLAGATIRGVGPPPAPALPLPPPPNPTPLPMLAPDLDVDLRPRGQLVIAIVIALLALGIGAAIAFWL